MSDLMQCADCGKRISKSAAACPHCGAPNKAAKRKKRGNTQGAGCLLLLVGGGLVLAGISPGVGGFLAVIGLVVLVVGFFL